jgi:hypothetical protein
MRPLLSTRLEGALERPLEAPTHSTTCKRSPCPYHKTPVNHTLKQCDLLKRYYNHAAAKSGESKKDGGDGNFVGFPAVENVFLIFGGPTVDMSNSQRKRERHEVLAAQKAPPSFLD